MLVSRRIVDCHRTSAQASELIDNVPFTINSTPFLQPEALSQLYGSGPFAIDFLNLINLGALQAQTTSAVAGAIPADTPVFGNSIEVQPPKVQ